MGHSEVGGWVNTHRGKVRLTEAVLHRGLTTKLATRVHLCDSRVEGDVTVRWASDVELGTTRQPGPDHCARSGGPGNTIGGTLFLEQGSRSVAVHRTVIAGDLVCTGNTTRDGDGVEIGEESVVVGGMRTGQCA